MGELKDTSTLIAWFYALSTIAAGLLVLWIAHLVARRIMAQIGGEPETAVEVAHAVADGRLDNNIVLQTNDNSSILATMQRMQAQLLERLTAERRVAAENLRIRIALDNVSTGVMIADNQRNIIYVNKSVHTVLKNAEAGIRQQLPNFSADNLVGQNIDAFHKNPAHQAKLLAEFTSAAVAKLTVGDRHMTVTANPVITAEGERVGAVAEWADRTQEVNAEAELKALLDAAVQGDFSKRIAQEGKQWKISSAC
jgi:methyl-accepting chemotaxis protein